MNKNMGILVAGACGRMGTYYLNNLIELGIDQRQIIAVDINPEKGKNFKEKYPKIKLCCSIEEAMKNKEIVAAFVATNTPSHHTVIVNLIEKNVDYIFCEKPLALDADKVNYIENHLRPTTKLFTAFLINFSGAVKHLEELMRREDMYLVEAAINWGKDRTGDTRPTPGDLEDESVHGINLIHNLAKINQSVKSIHMNARISYLDFVDHQVQKKARTLDPSFPDVQDVNSSSMIIEKIETDKGRISVSIISSFLNNVAQVRELKIVLSDSQKKPSYLAKIDFDTKDGDILILKKPGEKEVQQFFYKNNKVRDETMAFLEVAINQTIDPRLTGLGEAIRSVLFSELAKRSDETLLPQQIL